MKKLLFLMVAGIFLAMSVLAQNFSGSGLTKGQFNGNSDRSVSSTYEITQSSSMSVISGNSVSCNGGGLHTDNSYMRVFDLAGDFGISGAINVSSVDFGIELASSSAGTQPVSVRIYTLTPPLLFANLTLIASQNINVADQSLTLINVPISATIPANSIMVVEIFTPDGQASGNSFFVGSNNLGQTGSSYLAAASCGVIEPTATDLIGFPGMHLVMKVYADPASPVATPINSWALIIGIILIVSFIVFRFRRS